jgi:hypothetical protein
MRQTVSIFNRPRPLLVAAIFLACAAGGRADDAPKGPVKEKPEVPALPGITIDREKKIVELDGKIILPLQADWLELLACMPKSREHESIISLEAKPSHVHGALLLIGLKPGSPLRAERVNDVWKYHPPKGPKIAVTVIYEKEGKKVEVNASDWIVDQKTRKPLADSIWLFTGSKMHSVGGREIYVADVEGNILSLVNFGDEVLSRSTTDRGGQDGGGNAWAANTKLIPPTGTRIVVRLTPVKEDDKDQKQP